MQAEKLITAVVLAHQEDKKLRSCLLSLPSYWPVLILKSGDRLSSSFLKEIASESSTLVDRIHQIACPPITDYSERRNWALQQVETPWILFVDSDEALVQSDLSKLNQLLQNPQLAGLNLTRSDVFLGKQLWYGEAGRQPLLRVVRRDKTKFVGRVHEQAVVNGAVTDSNLQILHYSHDSIAQFMESIASYSRLAASNRNQGLIEIWFELLLFPAGKFVWNYIFRQGFLDGWRGLVYAVLMSWHSLLVRLYQLEKHNV